jgi:tRNA uridine 5-carboxymethylaminomethyl modification enzyme
VRQDNALRRLSGLGSELRLYDEHELRTLDRRTQSEDAALRLAESTSIAPAQAADLLKRLGSSPLAHAVRIVELARRQGVSLGELFALCDVGADLERESVITAELEIKYAGYFSREREQAEKMRRMGQFRLDSELPYSEMSSLSFEARQKLAARRPATLAQATRIPGVSPTDLQNLLIEIEKRRRFAGTP